MKIYKSKLFTGVSPWDAVNIANMNGITCRLHWTNAPYHWHINDGEEIFVVLDGIVKMHYKELGNKCIAILNPGDIFYAAVGCEHVAYPEGEARILVIEKEGSN